MFGHVGFEWAQYALIRASNANSNVATYTYDYESWAANKQWFFRMLDRVQTSKRQQIVMFGGDVHYACTAIVKYQLDWNSLPPVEVLHFTSSAIKNKVQPGWQRDCLGDAAKGSLATVAATMAPNLFPSQAGGQDAVMHGQVDNNWTTFEERGSGGNAHVYVHYPPICSEGQFLAGKNSIAVFIMERGANPKITNIYLDEDGTS